MSEKNQVDRRSFMQTTAAVSAAGMAAPALGRVLGANEEIQLGFIGLGGRGASHLNAFKSHEEDWNLRTAAVCDIYTRNKERAQSISGGDVYHDYGDLLARDDIDAVVISSPDHWHMPMAVDALKAGKHVYLEKPMTRTLKEAKKLYEVAVKSGLAFQVGTQYTSHDEWYQARKVIASGDVGKLLWSQGGYSRNSPGGEWNYYTIHGDGGPDTVDWKRFLGSAPKRKWEADRYFRWRKYWDYSGGIATDLFYHKLTPMLIALGPEFPVEVSAAGGVFIQKDGRDVPDTFFIMATYPSEHTVLLCSSMANSVCVNDTIRGNQATIYLHTDSHIRVVGESVEPYKAQFEKRHDGMEYTVQNQPRSEHRENFINAVRGLEETHCGAELAYKSMATIALGVEAFREGKTLHFDPKREKVIKRRTRRA